MKQCRGSQFTAVSCRLIVVLLLSTIVVAPSAANSAQLWMCQPALPVFCKNMHVGCSGHTKLPTARIQVHIQAGRARLLRADPDQPLSRMAPVAGNVTRDASRDSYTLIRFESPNGYLKILPDGTFSFRTYIAHQGAMAVGVCTSVPLEDES